MSALSLIEVARRHLMPGASAVPLHALLWQRLTDPRDPRGVRHSLSCLVSVLLAGAACGHTSMLSQC